MTAGMSLRWGWRRILHLGLRWVTRTQAIFKAPPVMHCWGGVGVHHRERPFCLSTSRWQKSEHHIGSRRPGQVCRFASTASTTSILGTNWLEFVEAKTTSVKAGTFGVEATGSREAISCLVRAITEV